MFEMTDRRGVVVWLYSLKQAKALRHYGTMIYLSKKMKYAYLYMDADQVPDTVAKLTKLRFVKKVETSPRPELATHYVEASEPGVKEVSDHARD